MQALDYHEAQKAKEAIQVLFSLGLIDDSLYQVLHDKITANTGE